jgi:hypothetical protein
VPADAGWVATGIVLSVGDTIRLAAHGQAITGPLRDFPEARSGPEGQAPFPCIDGVGQCGPCSLEGIPYGALIGRIGVDGDPFVIGSNEELLVVAENDGEELFLAVNDNDGCYADNRGGFIVLIRR